MNIAITIRGYSPLIMRSFSDESQLSATSGASASSSAPDRGTPREIAERALYRDEQGRIGVPQPNMLRCLVDGGSFHKIGRRQITTQRSSLLYSAIDIPETWIALDFKAPWCVDSRPVRIPATGGRILRHRPRFDEWAMSFTIELDLEVMNADLLRRIIDDSGKKIGLGDFRPATKGPFGRFRVVTWREQKLAPPAIKAVSA